MATHTNARRLPTEGGMAALEQPGDYVGPIEGYTGDKSAVFFLIPVRSEARRAADPGLRSIHHVTSPPHVFRECADGSLEIRESIGVYTGSREDGFAWHGYLDEGNSWREV